MQKVEAGIWCEGDIYAVTYVVGSATRCLTVIGIDRKLTGLGTVMEFGYQIIVTVGYEGARVICIAIGPTDELYVTIGGDGCEDYLITAVKGAGLLV